MSWTHITARLNELTTRQVAIITGLIGFLVFFTGLKNPFLGDDIDQIVSNPVVHSLANVRLFFEGGTFYAGGGIAPLGGVYYRPLMTTIFSLIYTLFGLHPLAFHLFQLFLCVGVSILIYMLLQVFFRPVIALSLSLLFLVHPINSQNVFAIPSLQDPLFAFFGLIALLLLMRSSSIRSLVGVATLLFLSLLSKEAGMYFVLISAIYLFYFDRKRVLPFVGIVALPVVLWLALRVHAVGWNGSIESPPIDRLSFEGRLFTMPSLLLFYMTKFIFPIKLATAYYWVYPHFSVQHVLIPLIIDLVVVAAVVWATFLVRNRVGPSKFKVYIFFLAWFVVGLLPIMQIVPLDFTVSETWFYFPFIGLLGMVAIMLEAFQIRVQSRWFLVTVVIILFMFGLRTALRGFDSSDQYRLALHDIAASKEDYFADSVIAYHYAATGDFVDAKSYAEVSVNNLPRPDGYNNLGVILMNLGDYSGANQAYAAALKYGDSAPVYENLCRLTLVQGSYRSNEALLKQATNKFPSDSALWVYRAVFAEKNNDNAYAKFALTRAVHNGANVPNDIYNGIMYHQPFTVGVGNTTIYIQ